MTAEIVRFQRPLRNHEHYFGACPECAGSAGYLNVGGNHWFVCDTHQARWWAGWNLFSSWQDEDEATWQRNAGRLIGYREVVPLPMEVAADGEG